MFDAYSLKARLWPALLVGMPAALALATVLNLEWWNASLVSLAGSIGFTFLLTQVVRHLGKKREDEMFSHWGGKPSVAFLRHGDPHLDKHTKARYHSKISVWAKITMPTEDEERRNPREAEHAYEAATQALISATRDTKRFNLLFRENINFGFCRNMVGVKPVGILSSVVAVTIGSYRLWSELSSHTPVSLFGAITFCAGTIMLGIWVLVVRMDWPKTSAYAYADRLLEAIDSL